jgi:ribonuclease BN (tRNA processing enzyme)
VAKAFEISFFKGDEPSMGSVKVRFLGTGDAVGSGGRLQTCIQILAEEQNFLMDCGATSLTAMKRFGVDPASIDLILVSHLHGDHFGGIPFFVIDAQFGRRVKPLQVAGPPGIGARVKEALEVFFPGSSQTQRKFETRFIELPEGRDTSLGVLSVRPYGVVHPSGSASYALQVKIAGKIITYSGDTEWTDSLVEAARGADLFICEAYFFRKKIKYHLNYETILAHRSRLGCRRIILTHMNQDMLDQLKESDLECAEDGGEILLEGR